MGDNNFWKEKFFYIVLLLLIGSFGWTTFIGWGLAQSISTNASTAIALAKSTDDKALALSKDNEKRDAELCKEFTLRDEVMLEKITNEFKEINQLLTELKTEVKLRNNGR